MSEYDGTAQRLHKEATERIFELNREENRPKVSLIDPVSNEANTIDVSKETLILNVTGLVEDQSQIASLQVNGFSVPVEKSEEGYKFLSQRESHQCQPDNRTGLGCI